MSVLVKGMEMPTNCEECQCSYWTEGVHHDYCQAVGYDTEIHYGEKGRPTWCPLIEIPPHGRLIDADALKPYMLNEHYKYRLVYDADEVANAPTIIEAEGE